MAGHPPLDPDQGGHDHPHDHDPDDSARQTRGWQAHYLLHDDGGPGYEHYHLHHERTAYDHHPVGPVVPSRPGQADHDQPTLD
jgi:hypothetical protein